MTSAEQPSLKGYYYAVSAMFMWGLFPIYWSLFTGVDTLEVLAHRTVWCTVFTIALLAWQKRLNLPALYKRPLKEWFVLTASAIMIATNWGLFIWAVQSDLVIEASMGYFLSPLMSIILGRYVFKEVLKPLHWFAIALAATGVIVQIIAAGVTPWLGLMIAASFSCYGGLRKLSTADSITGLLVETLILTPLALAYFVWVYAPGESGFINQGTAITALLIIGGAVTAIPLMLYVASARLLALSVVGFLFYINPSIQFLLGRFFFNEPFTMAELAGFSFIWIGLIIYTFDSYRRG